MTEAIQRRLTAIVSADVVGYSRIKGLDEDGTLAELKAHRNAVAPFIFNVAGASLRPRATVF